MQGPTLLGGLVAWQTWICRMHLDRPSANHQLQQSWHHLWQPPPSTCGSPPSSSGKIPLTQHCWPDNQYEKDGKQIKFWDTPSLWDDLSEAPKHHCRYPLIPVRPMKRHDQNLPSLLKTPTFSLYSLASCCFFSDPSVFCSIEDITLHELLLLQNQFKIRKGEASLLFVCQFQFENFWNPGGSFIF